MKILKMVKRYMIPKTPNPIMHAYMLLPVTPLLMSLLGGKPDLVDDSYAMAEARTMEAATIACWKVFIFISTLSNYKLYRFYFLIKKIKFQNNLEALKRNERIYIIK